jgi:hypothetical protein
LYRANGSQQRLMAGAEFVYKSDRFSIFSPPDREFNATTQRCNQAIFKLSLIYFAPSRGKFRLEKSRCSNIFAPSYEKFWPKKSRCSDIVYQNNGFLRGVCQSQSCYPALVFGWANLLRDCRTMKNFTVSSQSCVV